MVVPKEAPHGLWSRLQTEAEAYDRNPTERKWTSLRDRKLPGFEATVREAVACNRCVHTGVHQHAASLRQCAEALTGKKAPKLSWAVGGGIDPKAAAADYYTSVRELGSLHLTFKGAVARCLHNERVHYEEIRTSRHEKEIRQREGIADPPPWPEKLAPPHVRGAVSRARGPAVPLEVADALGSHWGGLFRWYGLMAGPEASYWEGDKRTEWDGCAMFRGVSEQTWREATQVFGLKFVRRDEQWDWGKDEAGRPVKNAAPSYVDDYYRGRMPEGIRGHEVGVGGHVPIQAPQRTPPEPSVTICWRGKR